MSIHSATRRFDREFYQLTKNGYDLVKHYGITNTGTTKRQIYIYKSRNRAYTTELTIKINKNDLSPLETYIKDLPRDINNVIFSFIRDDALLKYCISYTSVYPFQPPTWKLIRYRKNGEKHINDISNHYDLLYCNGREWSPAITMESEILLFVTAIPWFN
jgi:hypothetical protein